MHGIHCIKHWAKLQSGVALSSAEAELYACNKSATEVLGLKQLCWDLGDDKDVECRVDASACHSMLHRSGIGKTKHIQIADLWLQEKVNEGLLSVIKIGREINCADALTHYWSSKDGPPHFKSMNLCDCY